MKTMSQKKELRANRILHLLTKNQKMDVASLSQQLGVSQVTIRKDLDELETKGFVQRVHGYAQLNNTDHISGRLAYHYDEKKKIALKAAELIHDGDIIMIENGSCCAILASLLAQSLNSLTIITNSAFIADYIRDYKNVQVILLGGIYQHDSQCLVGPMIKNAASSFHVHHFFIGTDGYSDMTGFTNKDPMRAQAVVDMAAAAEDIIVLTESEKFQKIGTMPMALNTQHLSVITDQHILQEAVASLAAQQVRVTIVD